jgi:hypothetical protein
MRRGIATLALVLALALPASVSASNLDLRIGGFVPRANTGAENDLFRDDSELYARNGRPLKTSDWRGVAGGIQFNTRLAPSVELGFHLDGYGRTVNTAYRDFETETGRDITQSLRIAIVPLGVSLRVGPTGRRSRLAPYVSVGADLYFWKYEEFGDFIDFDSRRLDVIEDSFVSEGVTPGLHVAAGLRVPINRDLGFVGEVRYQWAKTDMGDDFRGNRLDLTGASITAGLNIRF